MTSSNPTATYTVQLDPSKQLPPLAEPTNATLPAALPPAKAHHTHPSFPLETQDVEDPTKLSIYFVGTATTIFESKFFRIMTDPNFLHAGDHVHLGPGVTAQRKTNPAVSMDELPSIDAILLSHFHEDHFDKHVQERLRKDLPIFTTVEATTPLTELGFSAVTGLTTWETALLRTEPSDDDAAASSEPSLNLKVAATPGKHVAGPIIESVNDFMAAVPPTTGFVLDLQWSDKRYGESSSSSSSPTEPAFRVYISGDTLFVKDLEEIPVRYPNVDLLLIHLGGTTIPGPHLPLLMVTMDAKQGIKLVQLIKPKVTLPIHFDDYDVFLSPLENFKKEMEGAGLADKVVYLDRGERFDFSVRR